MHGEGDLCRISVLLVTYNHAEYVRQALAGVFDQNLDEPIELVVADDVSTDDTMAIVKEHEGKDRRFRFRYSEAVSRCGATRNYQRGFSMCRGEYVAVIEGDDYWTSPNKLKTQLAFLEDHWECDACAVNYFVYQEERAKFTPRIAPGDGFRMLGARDLIADNVVGNFSTTMYRRSALKRLPQERVELTSYDWITNICIARYGLIGFLETPMSVYRVHKRGLWGQLTHIEKLKAQLEIIPAYDRLTQGVFHAEFDALAEKLKSAINARARYPLLLGRDPLAWILPRLRAIGRAVLPDAVRRYVVREARVRLARGDRNR